MADYRRSEIVTGLLVVVGFIVLSVFVFWYFALKTKGQPVWWEDVGVECESWFEDVGGLDKAAKVTMGGHRVGTVRDIRVVPHRISKEDMDPAASRPKSWAEGKERQRVRVLFTITDPEVRIAKESATVRVVQEGFIGPYHLSLDPGTWDPLNPAPKAVDLAGPTQTINPDRTKTLRDLVPMGLKLLDNVEAILAKIQTKLLDPLLENNDEHLKRMIPELRGMITEAGLGINELRGLVNPDAPNSPVGRFNKLMDNADQSLTDLRTQLTRDVIPPLRDAIREGTAALNSAKKAIDGATAVLDDAKPRLKDLLDNLKAESGRLQARLDEVQRKLRMLIDDADHLVSLRHHDLALMIESLRNTSWELELAARKVRSNPAVLIFGDESDKGLEASPRDDTGLRKSGRVKPYEQRDESPTKKE